MRLPSLLSSAPDSRTSACHRSPDRRRPLLLALLLLLAGSGRNPARGQGWTGLAHSNYGGTNNLYINPANLADSRHKLYLNVVSGGVNFNNDYLQLDLPGPAREFIDGTREFKREYFTEQPGGGAKSGSLVGELRLPSLMLSLGPRQGVAFTNRVRAFGQVSDVSAPLARLAYNGFGDADALGIARQLGTDNSFTLSTGAYHEFALAYARALSAANTTHFWKAGVGVKYLVGLGGGYLRNNGTEYEVVNDNTLELRNRDLAYGFTDYELYDAADFSIGQLYGSRRLGRGFGLDMGLSYEWRPEAGKYEYRMDGQDRTDHARNKYRLKLGLALTDLGAINYNNEQYVRSAGVKGSNTVRITKEDFDGIENFDAVGPTLRRLVGLSEEVQEFRSYLPATLRLTADYRLLNHLYAGLLWNQSLLPASAVGQRSLSSVALTPRIEFSHAEVAVPVILGNNYRTLQLGTMLRLGPLIVGSDNLGGLFGLTTTTGADLYLGLGLALHKRKLKDKDGDQVSNKLDKCPKVKGTWEFQGCPDKDGDHVQDAADECPDVAGLAQFKGCPDQDSDGIPDKLDKCPTEAGLPALQGCPDRDQDGITDSDDKCPDAAGLPALQGCPDRDGDGVTDAADQCPDAAGPADHAGCPDTDRDGLHDQDDQCPTTAGPADNNGCPYADQDGDQVPDKDDACPAAAGPVANKGCPEAAVTAPESDGDTDSDGVPDKTDACPQTPGPATSKGCPVLLKEEVKVLTTAFANLEFETGKAVIKVRSLASLNELAELLKSKPTFRLRLSGHTDNLGRPADNLLLSRQRTLAVKAYLVRQGTPAAHIRPEWFGPKKPKATNKTAAGRARNRRVEMKVVFD